jgi:hypothetical protein
MRDARLIRIFSRNDPEWDWSSSAEGFNIVQAVSTCPRAPQPVMECTREPSLLITGEGCRFQKSRTQDRAVRGAKQRRASAAAFSAHSKPTFGQKSTMKMSPRSIPVSILGCYDFSASFLAAETPRMPFRPDAISNQKAPEAHPHRACLTTTRSLRCRQSCSKNSILALHACLPQELDPCVAARSDARIHASRKTFRASRDLS